VAQEENKNFSILSLIKKPLPIKESVFGKAKLTVLDNEYKLSLVFVGDKKSKELNIKYRKGNYIPNVLSFPINKKCGEIFINPHQAKREHKDFNQTYSQFLMYLFIHGLLHLKGMDHSSKMEARERQLLKKFLA
jgi:probable rRNA maturation factor